MRTLEQFHVGDIVTVGQAYHMGGRFSHDGHEGTWRVVGLLAPADLKLARNGHGCGEWDIICHLGRIIEAGWYPNCPNRL